MNRRPQATGQQLQVCQSDGEKTKEALRNKETEMMNLEQRLNSMERLQSFKFLPRYLLWERRDGRACQGWIVARGRSVYLLEHHWVVQESGVVNQSAG